MTKDYASNIVLLWMFFISLNSLLAEEELIMLDPELEKIK